MKSVLKLFADLFGFIAEELITNEWKRNRWAFIAFFAPLSLVLLSWYGPLRGWVAFLVWLSLLLGVGVVRIWLPIIFRPKKVLSDGRTMVEHRGYWLEAEKCKETASALFIGGSLAVCFLTFVFLRSPEMKAVQARAEQRRQELIASGTLLPTPDELDQSVSHREGAVTHKPERVGDGQLIVMRVKIDRENAPVIAFLDPTVCKAHTLPSIGDKVKLKVQKFRATPQGMHADPGADTLMWMYFVEPVCK